MTRRSRPEAAAPEPHIRPVEDRDLDAVVALWHAAGLVVSYNEPAGDIAFCRASANAELFVAEEAGAVVATAMAGHDGHRGWLYYVASDPARRGEGLGRDIVAHAEAWLAALGVRKVNLIIRDANTKVQGFYERLGYATEPRTVMARWLIDDPR
ncbi:MAG: GNAT family acetyltransferase [Alphaproteobacteria bacterium]